MMKYFVIAFISFFFVVTARAADCINMQLQTGQTVINFASGTTVNPSLTVKANTNPGGCDFFITFGYGSSSSYFNRSLKQSGLPWPFQISKNSSGTQVLKNFPDVSNSNEVLTGNLAVGNNDRQVSVSYWAILDLANPWLSTGMYSDNITVSLYKGTLTSYSFVDSLNIVFQYNAPKRVDISVVSSGGSFNINDTTETMNFGTLSSGVSRTCDVIVKYNAGYILKASSSNDGRLKHQSQNVYVPYAITFRGTSVNLSSSASSPVQVFRELGQSPASGLVLPVVATIGTLGATQTGTYTDTITLTVESAE